MLTLYRVPFTATRDGHTCSGSIVVEADNATEARTRAVPRIGQRWGWNGIVEPVPGEPILIEPTAARLRVEPPVSH